MYTGMRVTDAVEYFRRRGELKGTVKVVRTRAPDRLRWRHAVSAVTGCAADLAGRDRQRLEEPVREVVLDLADEELRREVVLDARRHGVDLDRGEVLPRWTFRELRRTAFLTGSDLSLVERYTKLPGDFFAPIDTAAVVLVGRAFGEYHRRRAQKIWLELPDEDDARASAPGAHHHFLAERAREDAELSRRWIALSKTLLIAPS